MRPARLEGLLTKIRRIQSIMVAVSTGGPRIQEKEGEYQELYLEIAGGIESLSEMGLALSHGNPFYSLWDWYGHWSAELPSYASRRQYVREVYRPLVEPIESALHKHRVEKSSFEELAKDLSRRLESRPESPAQGFRMSFASFHTKIVQRCQVPFETGQYDDAIFNAMKAVEEEVRARISANPTDIGVALISKAMTPKSPLLTFSSVDAEQEAAHFLYRGAIGSFKNPLSHRFLDSSDPVKTFECLALASLLMRMLDEAT